MKIKIETDKSLEKTEIIIKCKEITPDIEAIQQAVLNAVQKADVVFYKNILKHPRKFPISFFTLG